MIHQEVKSSVLSKTSPRALFIGSESPGLGAEARSITLIVSSIHVGHLMVVQRCWRAVKRCGRQQKEIATKGGAMRGRWDVCSAACALKQEPCHQDTFQDTTPCHHGACQDTATSDSLDPIDYR